MLDVPTFTAFLGPRQVAHGALEAVAAAVANAGPQGTVLVFEDATGQPVDLDLRAGPAEAARAHLAGAGPGDAGPAPRPGRGRPRLGVVAREVTLLPRHWDWLAAQPGGASAALRRLVDEARRTGEGPEQRRQARDAAYRVMAALAGDLAGFEAASRALFAGEAAAFERVAGAWPADVAAYVQRLAAPALVPPA